MTIDSDLGAQLAELAARFRSDKVALIGGVAVAAHGFVRGTRDLDFLYKGGEHDQVRQLMESLGYETLMFGPDLSSFVRGLERADFLFANRQLSERFLCEAGPKPELPVRAVAVEALLD